MWAAATNECRVHLHKVHMDDLDGLGQIGAIPWVTRGPWIIWDGLGLVGTVWDSWDIHGDSLGLVM